MSRTNKQHMAKYTRNLIYYAFVISLIPYRDDQQSINVSVQKNDQIPIVYLEHPIYGKQMSITNEKNPSYCIFACHLCVK